MTDTLVAGAAYGVVYGALAMGIVLVYRTTGALHLAQGEIGALALYPAWAIVSQAGRPWFVGALAGTGLVVVVMTVFSYGVARHTVATPLSLTVATAGLLVASIGAQFVIWGGLPRSMPPAVRGPAVTMAGVTVPRSTAVIWVVGAACCLGLVSMLRWTQIGVSIRAVADDLVGARLSGISVDRVSLVVWLIVGVLAAASALTIAPLIGAFGPGLMSALFVRSFAAALIGGLDSLPGAFAGGVVVGVIEGVVQSRTLETEFPGLATLATMLSIVVVVILRPSGPEAQRP